MDRFKAGKLLTSEELFKNFKGVGREFNLLENDFLLVSFHPITTEYNNLREATRNLLAALSKINMKTIMLWPNADAGNNQISKEIRIFRELNDPDWLYLFKNLPVEVYLQLMFQAKCLIGNSSSIKRR